MWVRLVNWGTSWTARVDVHRVETSLTDSQVGAIQVQELDQRNTRDKVVVEDSFYANHLFLKTFQVVKNVKGLVRLCSNSTLYEPPLSQPEGKKGAPPKHGAKFKLSALSRPADRNETFLLGKQTVILQAWQGLHFKKLSKLVGMVIRVEFLKPDGTPRYKRPMWLPQVDWTGYSCVERPVLDVFMAVCH